MLLLWEDYLLTGNKTIDRQHKRLFDLVNELDTAQEQNERKEAFLNLYHYTREHFNAEESLMQKSNYPDFKAHKKLHEELLGQLSIVASQPLTNFERYTSFRVFIDKWLIDHIEKEDKAFGLFMKN